MSRPNQSLYHIGLRYAALASKPALIWFLVATGSPSAAVQIGSLMLVASLIGMALSNEAHLQFYAAVFSERRQSDRALFSHLSTYLHALVTHILLIAVPAFIACVLFFPKVDPVLALVLAFAERVADELLRFRLYKKEWNRWIAQLVAKSAVPAVAVVIALAFSAEAVGWAYVLASLAFSLALLAKAGRVVRKAIKVAFKRLPNAEYIRSYLLSYMRLLSLRQIAAILGMNVVVLDRYVGMTIWSQNDIAYLLLAGQIVNGIFFALEAKFLSEHRANFINEDANLASFWRWKPYLTLIALCIVLAAGVFAGCTVVGVLPMVEGHLYLAVGLMVMSYALFYSSIPLNDYLYYRRKHLQLSMMHLAFFSIYAGLVVSVPSLHPPVVALSILVVLLLVRLITLEGIRRGFDRQVHLGVA